MRHVDLTDHSPRSPHISHLKYLTSRTSLTSLTTLTSFTSLISLTSLTSSPSLTSNLCLYFLSVRKYEFLPIPLAECIIVKEVTIKSHLDEPSNPANPVYVVLNHVSVYPVENVERSIESHRDNVVRGQILHLSQLL
eukprot:GHVN01104621.1.p2 GENE.GHVN01104621.1~~GHVN01104621.1.p2  ORF type:complete len:137 (+),score=33.86 GHVN01104621.1:328-738(+)